MTSRWLLLRAAGSMRAVRNSRLQPQQHHYITKRTMVWSSWSDLRSGGGGNIPGHAEKRPWQAEQNLDIQRVTQTAIIHELTRQQARTIENIVPWFLQTMPASYFRQVPESFRTDHLKAIAAVTDANMDMHLNLKSHLADGRQVHTFIRPGTKPGVLLDMVQELPFDHRTTEYVPLSRVAVFSALDASLSLSLFVYGEEKSSENFNPGVAGSRILEYAKQLQAGEFVKEQDGLHPEPNPWFEREVLLEYLEKCSETFLLHSDPRRFLKMMLLFRTVSGTEGTAVGLDQSHDGQVWVDVAVANSIPHVALIETAQLLYLQKFDVERVHLDVVSDGKNGNVTLLRMLVKPVPSLQEEDDKDAPSQDERLRIVSQELKRSKWLDASTSSLIFDRYQWLGIKRGEIITAFCSLMHPIMAKRNPLVFSKANIFDTVTQQRYIPLAAAIADLFLDRFNPKNPLSDQELETRANELWEKIENDTEDTIVAELLEKMIDIVKHTLKTNIYMNDRYALGLRLDPNIMESENSGEPRELPYGILFAHGRRLNAFHVRFRDIARGGMRLVTPQTPEQYALESAHLYDECHGLAYAQQLKNKDIPEGGSKAVNLIDSCDLSAMGRNFVMRKSVKAFTDTILDLVVDTPETRENIVDLVGKKEVLYLGPDEQVIPEDIEWIIERAVKRGYGTPAAFMSSKPRSGINHKEYGVTSEGVNVYLDVALRNVLGIDPNNESFTIKLTGGPDGDVAGNEIQILIREYGDNVKIVGIADHSGCAEDPEGLDHSELLRLVKDGLCISNFNPAQLGEGGVVHHADTEEGFRARNTMHNRIEADAFVPAGGRPNTIDVHNYKSFLKEDGKTPSSPLIVEGANLFVTAEARQLLYDEGGVLIVKDSSANKCGVITSSYEICAAMMLSEDEFFDNKEQIVGEVLIKLRELAKMEAELLFREFDNYQGSLPHISQVISNSINVATDALTAALDALSEEDRNDLLPLFRAHLPKTIADLAFDRVHERVPEQYIKNAIASCLASKMVYKEGTKFIESQPQDKLAKNALAYLEKEKEIAKLAESLATVDMPEDEKLKIIKLLDAGGARTSLNIY